MEIVVAGVIFCFFVLLFFKTKDAFNRKWKQPKKPLNAKSITFLHDEVSFYRSLNPEDRKLFEFKVNEFVQNVTITGIDCEIEDEDMLMVAASAIIPIFAFPEWQYLNLDEVLVYPSSFNQSFRSNQHDSAILGMVGSGPMEGKMILSRKALHDGFRNEDDAHNTAIHEFVHLIDKMDGEIDGIPSLLLEKQYTLPWLALMDEYIQKIRGGKSEFNPYAGTNREEFFAELSVYFFEKPKELKLDHPELYHVLEQVFQQKMSKQKQVLAHATRRNDPCPCGSGKKFKHCCGN